MNEDGAEYRVISDLQGLKSLAPEWERLAGGSPNPLLSFDWFSTAAGTLHGRDDLNVVVVNGTTSVRAIAPLVRRKTFGIPHLEFIGSKILKEPSGMLYGSPADLRSLLKALNDLKTPLLLEKINDPDLAAELSTIAGDSTGAMRNKPSTSPWIRTDGGWEDYYATISAKWRSAHRRALKKAEGEGKVEFSFFSPNPTEFDQLLKDFIAVEHAGWKGRMGTSLAVNDPLRIFFQTYGNLAASKGILRLAFMKIGDIPVGAQYAVEYGKRIWLLKIGYDEKWASCSPGILLMYAMLERAFVPEIEAFEFLGNDEPWLQRWDHEKHEYHSFRIDSVRTRVALGKILELPSRVRNRVRTRLARRGKGS